MTERRSEKEVEGFYRRWSRPVLAFCRLFVGNQEGGEEAAREVFLAYFRQGLSLELDQWPVPLLRCSLNVLKEKCALVDRQNARNGTLEGVILLLPCEQRAVFVLRNVLRVETASVAAATGMPEEQVRNIWIQSMLAVRELLPRSFFEERTQ
jgi:DNA-directed RNA polymerase specialized sigma24 family protein